MSQQITVERLAKTSKYFIRVDDADWGIADGLPVGRSGVKFFLKDSGRRLLRYTPPGRRRSKPVSYEAYAMNHKEVAAVLVPLIKRAIDEGNLKDPATVQAEIAADNARRDQLAKAGAQEKYSRFAVQAIDAIKKMKGYNARKGIAPEDVDAIIEAMEWAQSQ